MAELGSQERRLSFDVILSRLQGELQKSRETGAQLNTLTGAMGEIHDALGGGLVSSNFRLNFIQFIDIF